MQANYKKVCATGAQTKMNHLKLILTGGFD